jgi:hypothetical protein
LRLRARRAGKRQSYDTRGEQAPDHEQEPVPLTNDEPQVEEQSVSHRFAHEPQSELAGEQVALSEKEQLPHTQLHEQLLPTPEPAGAVGWWLLVQLVSALP